METQNIEYKTKWKDEYLHYISGFANASGGTLYIGYADNGTLVGIDDAKGLLERLPNKAVQSTGLVPEINIHTQDGKDYLTITVKPSAQPISCNGKYYLRSGSTLQELNGTALTDFLTRQTNTEWDKQIVPEATLNDIDPEAVGYFVQCAIDMERLNKRALHDSTEKILRNLDLINAQGYLTNAALLLFGKNIKHWNMTAVFRIGRFGASRADLIMQDTIDCPLILMPDKIISILRSGYLVSPIKYEGLHRIEPLEVPEDALREMICNAIVHKNYTGTFTQMRIWNDKIELWNQGTLPDNYTVETLMQDHESYPRNKLIANVFFMAGFIEAWGRGYEKIREEFEKAHLQVPVFEQVRGGVMATILRENFMKIYGNHIPQNVGDNVGDVAVISGNDGGNMAVMKLTERQRTIIKLIKINPYISATQMSVIMSVIKRTIERELATLRKVGIIARDGSPRTGKWIVLK